MIRGMLVGTGQIALAGHIPAYIQDRFLSYEVQIIAAVDVCTENLRACAALLPGIRVYQTIEEAFSNENVDFIDICAPPYVQTAVIREAASRGLHILCEKPIATCLREGLEIQRFLAQHLTVFMPCYQYPFSPLWQAVLKQVQEGKIGEARFVLVEDYRERADPGSPHWRPGWRQRREIAGGGVLLDIGTHYFHLMHLLFGPPVAVTARTACLSHEECDVEDTAVVILEYPTWLVELRLSWVASRRETRLYLAGTAGSLIFDGTTLRADYGKSQRLWTFSGAMSKSAYPMWYAKLFREFFRAILDGQLLTKPLDDAINVLRCVEAAYASASRGQTVMLADFVG